MDNLVSILIVTYNGEKYIKKMALEINRDESIRFTPEPRKL